MFKRAGADLTIDKEISLLEALCGTEFEIQLLNGEKLHISTQPGDIINPKDIKTIKGKGMPLFKDATKFGNLYVHFKVHFPLSGELNKEQLDMLAKVLNNSYRYFRFYERNRFCLFMRRAKW